MNGEPSWAQLPACALEMPPSDQLGELFRDVQSKKIFHDSKTFADLHYSEAPAAILADYQAHKDEVGFDLSTFVHRHFSLPSEGPTVGRSLPDESIDAYVWRLWGALRHESNELSTHSSLLPLPHPYVVPGGRFRELYYWDSYFAMLGLEADGQHDLALDMLKDFAFEIDCYGHVPNGNRTYYLSRSQPPFFSMMVDLIAEREGEQSYVTYLPELEAEYEYWMDGSAVLRRGQSYRRVVRLSDGTLLNRYWDDRAEPRDESYREDIETALARRRDPADIYRNIRAATESGWDFSSRWLADGHNLSSIRTVSLLPVDLNCLMAHLERTLAKAYRIAGHADHPLGFLRWQIGGRPRSGRLCGVNDLECLPITTGKRAKLLRSLLPLASFPCFSISRPSVRPRWSLKRFVTDCYCPAGSPPLWCRVVNSGITPTAGLRYNGSLSSA